MRDIVLQNNMRSSQLIVDGLWYCFCPAFRPSHLRRPYLLPLKSIRAAPRISLNFASSRRTISTGSRSRSRENRRTSVNKNNEDDGKSKTSSSSSSRYQHYLEDIQSQSVGDLESRLEYLTSRKRTDIFRIVDVLEVLLQKHSASPTIQHYRAYILGNIHRRCGSSKNIRSLLQEMERQEITADSATLHAALEVLAVHPDFILRQEIIEALRTLWLSLSPAGWHHLIAGLVHEGQFELALDRLDQMERKGIPLEQWLHSLLIYKLCDANEFAEVLHLLQARSNKAKHISTAMWVYLLRAAIASSHFDSVRYIWSNVVDLGYTDLESSDCREVLRVASEYGNINFAESVFRHLLTLQQRLDLQDYERLLQVYFRNGDIKSAFEIICQMSKSKIFLTSESIQLILRSLGTTTTTKMNNNDPTIMWKEVSELRRKRKFEIPVTLANLVIEYCGMLFKQNTLSASEAIELALYIYKDTFEVCADGGANLDTFNNLFELCRQTGRPDVCTFLAKEMMSLGVQPDQRTLETLIVICVEAGNFASASSYLADLKAQGWELNSSVTDQIKSVINT